MSSLVTILVFLILAIAAWYLGNTRSLALANGDPRNLHSRPAYYGYLLALCYLVPAVLVYVIWSVAQSFYLDSVVFSTLPSELKAIPDSTEVEIAIGAIRSLSTRVTMGAAEAWQIASVDVYRDALSASQLWRGVVSTITGLGAVALVLRTYHTGLRARNIVETVVRIFLIACASVAILTTVGIVLSMVFETLEFFEVIAPTDFFFGTTWDPGYTAAGDEVHKGDFGVIPLIFGTLYVAFIALLVAVPIGLLSATYLAEYASPRFRATAKPLLEILAGIPTVVYGFFALVTVGPALSAGGDFLGLDISARSVLTAGLVMGIMIIPFISSLSDDVITQVPRSLREGSLGLGATKSETIRKVIFPAAIPGIVGSILLAASRAIGETMIVVMAAGVAPNLTANPFEAMTTVTVKIVTQLTGDADFTSPQALVAFALGMTLFVITLGMNVYALHIVRKYREQYD